jgi:hypothetical protein
MTKAEYIDSLAYSLYRECGGSFICAQATNRLRGRGTRKTVGLDLLLDKPLSEKEDLQNFIDEERQRYPFLVTVTILAPCFQTGRWLDDEDNKCFELTLKDNANLEEVAEQLLLLYSIFKLTLLVLVVNGFIVELGEDIRTKEGIVAAIEEAQNKAWTIVRDSLLGKIDDWLRLVRDSAQTPPKVGVWTATPPSVIYGGLDVRLALPDESSGQS